MPEQTIADLRARLERATDPHALPRDHPIWGLLTVIGPDATIPEECPGFPYTDRLGEVVKWLLADLVNAAEKSARAHVKILEQQLETEAWKAAAVTLSNTLAQVLREGKASLTGKLGEARRAAIRYVALRADRSDVLGVQSDQRSVLRPFEGKRGHYAGMKDGPLDVEETAPL